MYVYNNFGKNFIIDKNGTSTDSQLFVFLNTKEYLCDPRSQRRGFGVYGSMWNGL